jgi:hypothetical protein
MIRTGFAQVAAPTYSGGVARLFISQGRLDAWSAEDRVRIHDDLMTLSGDGRSFRLRAAIRFVKVSSDGGDPHQLVGRVKLLEDLARLGGEQFMESVIVGETAYEVQSGFVGEPVAAGAPA